MKIKKCNAVLGLLSVLCLLLHVSYSAFCYLTMYYNPVLKEAFIAPLMLLTLLHAVLGMMNVFMLSDGTRLTQYPKRNIKTILQRGSAALIFPFLILHLDTFSMMKSSAESGKTAVIILLMLVQILFYAAVLLHIAVSVSRALITLGLLQSVQTQKRIDKVCLILAAVLLAAAAFCVIKGQAVIFLR